MSTFSFFALYVPVVVSANVQFLLNVKEALKLFVYKHSGDWLFFVTLFLLADERKSLSNASGG